MAAQHLRAAFPQTAEAIVEFSECIRVARFSFADDDSRTAVGLFYLQRSRNEGRPLALVGFAPNPTPDDVPPYWSLVPAQLRDFYTHVHDGLVEDHFFDNGPVALDALATCEQYASRTGAFDELDHITAYDASYLPVSMSDVARPPAMCVVANNGNQVAYMFEITDPGDGAWSFGDDALLHSSRPIAGLLDEVMAARLIDSSRHPDDNPDTPVAPPTFTDDNDPLTEDRFLSYVSTEIDNNSCDLAARGECDPAEAAACRARQKLRDKGYLVHQSAEPQLDGENRIIDPVRHSVRHVADDQLPQLAVELPYLRT